VVHTETIDLPRPRTRGMLTSDLFFQHRSHLAAALGLLDDPVQTGGDR